MITKNYRDQYKDKGFTFKAAKGFLLDKRSNITITDEETGNSVKLSILLAFNEMHVTVRTDMEGFSVRFKNSIMETIDHIAKMNEVNIVIYSFYAIYAEEEVIEWNTVDGYKEYSNLFKGVTLNGDVPVKLYDKKALYYRIDLNKHIVHALNRSKIMEQYKMKNHLAHIQIWWEDEEGRFKELLIYSQGRLFVKSKGFSENELVFQTVGELKNYLENIA